MHINQFFKLWVLNDNELFISNTNKFEESLMFQNHGINIFNDIYQEHNIVTSTNIIDKKIQYAYVQRNRRD